MSEDDEIERLNRASSIRASAKFAGEIRDIALECAAIIAETPPHDYGFQTGGDKRRAYDIARRIRGLKGNSYKTEDRWEPVSPAC